MTQLFMFVVILALLPAAIQTAVVLGILAWYVFLGALAIGACIFLLYNPALLFWLITIGGGVLAVTWGAAQIETRWPGSLQKIGYGSAAFISVMIGFIVIADSASRNKNMGDAFAMAIICWIFAGGFGWFMRKAKPIDMSQWLKR